MLRLDTLLIGEMVCVHYNLGNSCYISTKELLLRIEVRSVEYFMNEGQKYMVYFTIFNHDTEWASIYKSCVYILVENMFEDNLKVRLLVQIVWVIWNEVNIFGSTVDTTHITHNS